MGGGGGGVGLCGPKNTRSFLIFGGKNSKGWEFSCPYNFIGSLPESSTRGLLVGKLLVGGLGVSC